MGAVRQICELSLLACFGVLAILNWNNCTDNEQRVMVGMIVALLVGLTRCCVIFRLCINSPRFDFHITVLFSTIIFINTPNTEINLPLLSQYFHSLSFFLILTYTSFCALLMFNILHYLVVILAMALVGTLNLFRIWFSSNTMVSAEGLSQLEFDTLPKKIITEEPPAEQCSAQHDCAICLSGFLPGETQITIVQCNHRFHSECIRIWFKNSVLCPYCRSDVRKSLQKIKFQNHILFHKGNSVLDVILEQVEPSFSFEEFINENNLREMPSMNVQNQQNNNQGQVTHSQQLLLLQQQQAFVTSQINMIQMARNQQLSLNRSLTEQELLEQQQHSVAEQELLQLLQEQQQVQLLYYQQEQQRQQQQQQQQQQQIVQLRELPHF